MIPYIIVSLRFKARLSQQPKPLRVTTNILLLDRFRHSDIMQQEEVMINFILIFGPYDNRLDRERKKNDLTTQMSIKQFTISHQNNPKQTHCKKEFR